MFEIKISQHVVPSICQGQCIGASIHPGQKELKNLLNDGQYAVFYHEDMFSVLSQANLDLDYIFLSQSSCSFIGAQIPI